MEGLRASSQQQVWRGRTSRRGVVEGTVDWRGLHEGSLGDRPSHCGSLALGRVAGWESAWGSDGHVGGWGAHLVTMHAWRVPSHLRLHAWHLLPLQGASIPWRPIHLVQALQIRRCCSGIIQEAKLVAESFDVGELDLTSHAKLVAKSTINFAINDPKCIVSRSCPLLLPAFEAHFLVSD